MVKAIMHGCNGHMGRVVTDICVCDNDIEIVAGIDPYTEAANDYPVFAKVGECDVDSDVIIDFSNASAVDELIEYAISRGVPVVLCTTGLSDEQLTRIEEASSQVAILRSANMSLGINTLMDLVKKAASVFVDSGYDIEIVEKHHNRKLDAPSGTAIALADSINEEYDGAYEYVYDRSTRREKRSDKEIGISAVRGGTIVGDHDVIFAGLDEVITLSHRAYSRSVFAKGAVAAAKFLAGRKPGLYDMHDVIADSQ